MSKSVFTNKYLSVFISRFIPAYFRETFPRYEEFIKLFLQYLEQNEKTYDNITNYLKFFDLDEILRLKNSAIPEQQALGDALIDRVYEQFLGSIEARFLSSLLDEQLFLKHQSSLIRFKGTKYAFLFFFLLVLGGYFKIVDANRANRRHNGFYLHNGLITYGNNSTEFVSPYIYIVISNFYPDQYRRIIDVLNPAGMFPLKFYQKLIKFNSPTLTAEQYLAMFTNAYVVWIRDTDGATGGETRIGMTKVVKYQLLQSQPDDSVTFDLETIDLKKYSYVNPSDLGATGVHPDYILFETVANDTMFPNETFNKIRLVNNPNPGVDYFYKSAQIISEGTLLFEGWFNPDDYSEVFPIVSNTSIQVLVKEP